jgi:hypothetical protein
MLAFENWNLESERIVVLLRNDATLWDAATLRLRSLDFGLRLSVLALMFGVRRSMLKDQSSKAG